MTHAPSARIEGPQPRGDAVAEARTVTLGDHASVLIRRITPGDAHALTALYSRLSPDTASQRFFTVMKRLPPEWAHTFSNVDYRGRVALVAAPGRGAPDGATRGDRAGAQSSELASDLIGVARYEALDTETAEVAIVVRDDWQGRGLGRVLLRDLLHAAEANGFRRFTAHVLAGNRRALRLLSGAATIESRSTEKGVTTLRLRLARA